jgi:hypothetical protein
MCWQNLSPFENLKFQVNALSALLVHLEPGNYTFEDNLRILFRLSSDTKVLSTWAP